MRQVRFVSAALFLLSGYGIIHASPPRLDSILPHGGQRGSDVLLVVQGDNLAGDPELLLAVPAPRKLAADASVPPTPQRLAFRFRIDASVATGVYPVRVRTADGISNLLLFSIGDFPEAAETEPNDETSQAQAAAPPVIINGSLGNADRDDFKFSAAAGQTLAFEVEARRLGSAIDPTLRLLGPNGGEMDFSDDPYGLEGDARLQHTFKDAGEYIIQVHDSLYSGKEISFYRLKIGAFSFAEGLFPLGGRRGSEIEVRYGGGNLPAESKARVRLDHPFASWVAAGPPDLGGGSSPANFRLRIGDLPEINEARPPGSDQPLDVEAPVTINGRLEAAGELDRYRVAVKPGEKWVFEVDSAALGSWLDAVLTVYNEKGEAIGTADDTGGLPDPRLEIQAPQGAVHLTIGIEDLHRRGGAGYAYRLTARPLQPDFILSLLDASASIPLRGTVVVGLEAVRRGYDGPIRIDLVNAPPGFAVSGGNIPGGQTKGFLGISGPASWEPGAFDLIARGSGGPPEHPLQAFASATIVLARDGNNALEQWRQDGLAAAVAQPLPLALRAGVERIEAVLGQETPVPFEVERRDAALKAEIKLAPLAALNGVTPKEGRIGEGETRGMLSLTAAPGAAIGFAGELAVRGACKIGGKDAVVDSAVYAVTVVPPFDFQLASQSMSCAPGAKAALSGTVSRRAPFAGDLEARFDGLPEGMKTAAVAIPASSSAFQLDLEALETLKPGPVEVRVILAAKLGDPKKPTVYTAAPARLTLNVQPPAPKK